MILQVASAPSLTGQSLMFWIDLQQMSIQNIKDCPVAMAFETPKTLLPGPAGLVSPCFKRAQAAAGSSGRIPFGQHRPVTLASRSSS